MPQPNVLRTPDSRFVALPDYPFEPHYLELADARFDRLRMHYIDEGPRGAPVVLMLHGEPTLVLHGDLDARAPISVGRELHERIPDSRLVVLPGIGHLSNVEAPDTFNRSVREFLVQLPR